VHDSFHRATERVEQQAADFGDRCFVTFRYSSDARQAVNTKVLFPDAPQVKATRAAEPTDVLWYNLRYQGNCWQTHVLPYFMGLLVLLVTCLVGLCIYLLTFFKLDLANNKVDSSGYLPSAHESAPEDVLAEAEPIGVGTLQMWLREATFTAVYALFANAPPEDRTNLAVLVVSLVISAALPLVNNGSRTVLSMMVTRVERPGYFTLLSQRIFSVLAFVYIVNYCIVPWLVYSALMPSPSEFLQIGVGNFSASACTRVRAFDSSVLSTGVSGCFETLAEDWYSFTQIIYRYAQRIASPEATAKWYGSEGGAAAGLIPQMVVLSLTDPVLTVFLRELIAFVKTRWSQFYGKLQFTQQMINACYEPGDFKFAERHALVMKTAAVVLIFGAAAPLLYFIGFVTMLFSFVLQKAAFIKLYKRPAEISYNLAERSRVVFKGLIWFHAVFAFLFTFGQAIRTETEIVTSYSLAPLVMIGAYELLMFFVLGRLFGTAVSTEDFSAGGQRFQEVSDEIPTFEPYLSAVDTHSISALATRSTRSTRPALKSANLAQTREMV